ncbi:MAG: 4-alpha-glucanotransferase [Clostridiales bacterium]|nr:4-alpha-glucanotransferase [Clostridiales bacterium]
MTERNSNRFARSAGILLPVSSLPSPYGIGAFGEAAYKWVGFLHEAKQCYWQILPLVPVGDGDSPYSSFSAFAGNPFFIDLDTLHEEGLLEREDYADISWGASGKRVDYDTVRLHRGDVLRKAFARFTNEAALADFAAQESWFEDYGLYMAIKKTQGMRSWIEWEEPLRLRRPDAIAKAREELAEEIRFHAFAQYQFRKQWRALRSYANGKGVEVIGDIPIYVSLDSVEVWANPELFQVDEHANLTNVAGCPPDGFSPDGQIWGNPLYDWDRIEETGFDWWIRRLRHNFELYDVLRIDHFRGLESYFSIPYGADDAESGRWITGPGMRFINAIKQALPDARIIAENLGFPSDAVRKLLADSGYPGMKLIQAAFDPRSSENESPDSYKENLVVYPGTHDNDTVKGWSENAPRSAVKKAMDYLEVRSESELPHAMIELAMQCKAVLAIIPMQDWLGLGSEARFNTPSTVGGNNWRWRLDKTALTSRLAGSIAQMTALYDRCTCGSGAAPSGDFKTGILGKE